MNRIEEVLQHRRKFAVFPMVCADHCSNLLHQNFKSVATDGKKLAYVLEYGYNLYQYDGILLFSDPYVEAEAMGLELDYNPYPKIVRFSELIREDSMELIRKDFIRGKEIKALRLKSEEIKGLRLKSSGRVDEIIKAAKLLKKKVDVPIFVSIKGPFTLTSFIVGPENFLKMLLNRKEMAEYYIDVALQFQLSYLKKLLQLGVHIFIGDPMASASVISPALFKKYAYEPLAILIKESKLTGVYVGVHICGDTEPIIDQLDSLGADILSIEDISLKTKTLKMGGVSTLTLLNGTPEEIKKEIKKALKSGRLILSSSCDVPVNTPIENIKLMVDEINKKDGFKKF